MTETAFTLTIRLGNDTMRTGNDVADALDSAARKLREGYGIDYVDEWTGLGAAVWDANGNRVGRWGIEREAEPAAPADVTAAAARIRALNRRLAARDGDGWQASPEDQAAAALGVDFPESRTEDDAETRRFWTMEAVPSDGHMQPYGADTVGIVDENEGGVIAYVHRDAAAAIMAAIARGEA